MKKVLYFAAALAVVSLASCGNGEKGAEGDTTVVVGEEEIEVTAEPSQQGTTYDIDDVENSGSDAQEQGNDLLQDAQDKANDMLQDSQDKANDMLEQAKEQAKNMTPAEAAEAAKKAKEALENL